jgi:hypothetical protein
MSLGHVEIAMRHVRGKGRAGNANWPRMLRPRPFFTSDTTKFAD